MSILPSSSHLEIKSFYAAQDSLAFHDACSIRYNVFVVEQGFSPDNEFDKIDETCVHLLAYQVSPAWGAGRSVPVGTLRVHQVLDSAVAKIGRVAVMKPHRNQGIARQLLSVAEDVARSMGLTQCILHSQLEKRAVYEKFGYRLMEDAQDQQHFNENLVSYDGIGTADLEDRRGQFLEEGVWHVKMYKDIL
ncbi:hypothetical protein KP509_35G010100 [Ceratopteris richardii]|uniref:N-acetyltransferase domain-containing protein n=1 Tax=Ceratopteris richardii TaxID=49495 RepID=A0A8T2QEJ0_CERRI|nr:hypothetical protein KP509_35G010100 [Ceratopteris richardii]